MSQTFPEPEPESEPTSSRPPVPASPQLRRPDWKSVSQTSLTWMEQSQRITAKLLYDLGGWIFGGLLVVALMLLQVLISLGSVDHASVVAGVMIAIALPFNLAGLGIIRYFQHLNQAVEEARLGLAQNSSLDEETLDRLTLGSQAFPPAKHRVMDTAVTLALFLSVLFTLIGLASALWHISWVATLLFLVASVLGILLVLRVLRYSA